MRTEELQRNCPECQREYVAKRHNQIYCSNKCKYDFNNRIARHGRNGTTSVDLILHKNRTILQELFEAEEPSLVSRQELMNKDFNFSYHTHTLQTKDTKVKVDFTYEYGLAPADNGYYKIIHHARV